MNQKKIINRLAALSEEITVCDVNEESLKGNCTRLNITVDHIVHSKPCPHCGSKKHKKQGTKPAWVMHIPQEKRHSTRIQYQRQRFLCKTCGGTYLEDISWIYEDSHLTVL